MIARYQSTIKAEPGVIKLFTTAGSVIINLLMKNLVIISQIQRSGGTLLSELFDNHPQCSVYPGECMLLKGAWPSLLRLYYRRKLFSLDDPHFQRYVTSGYDRSADEKSAFVFDFKKRDNTFNPGPFPGEARILSSFFKSIFAGWDNFTGNRNGTVVAFSPALISKLAVDLPARNRYFAAGGRMITIVRDPGSWYLSARGHSSSYGGNCLNKQYIPSVQAALGLAAKYPRQVFPIMFSELTTHPETVMRHLADALRLDFTPSLLMPTFNGELIQSNASYKSVKGEIAPKEEKRYTKDDDIDWVLSWLLYDKCLKRFSLLNDSAARSVAVNQ